MLLALLLAITPLVAGFLLFDATRGLLEGWLRVLTDGRRPAAIRAGAQPPSSSSILTPLLDHMVDQQARGQFEFDAVTPVGLVVLVFSVDDLRLGARRRDDRCAASGCGRFARPVGRLGTRCAAGDRRTATARDPVRTW